MKIYFAAGLALMAVILFQGCTEDRADTQKLLGKYQLVRGDKGGQEIPADRLKDVTVHIAANAITTFDKDKKEVYAATYQIDPTQQPWRITMTATLTPVDGKGTKAEGLINQWLFWWCGGPEAAIDALLWERIIKPRVLKRPGNDPGILADATARLSRFLPVLDRQLEGRDFVVGRLTIADFAIAPRLDRDPAFLQFDVAPYRNIAAWLARLAGKPYWATA